MYEGSRQSKPLQTLGTSSMASTQGTVNRLYSPEAYLERLTPHLETYGITRLADVTGLDRIGVPVVQAVRPLALSNAVNQGKGLTLAEAAVSSVMEALETYFSETPEAGQHDIATPANVYGADAEIRLKPHLSDDLPDTWTSKPIPFLQGIDLLTGAPAQVPAALVKTDYTPASPHADTPFIRTTTGLGGGASREEALIHALYETLERLSTGRAMQIHGFFERFRTAEEDVVDPPTAQILDRLRETGVLHAVHECPPIGGFPVAWVRLLDAKQSTTSLPFHADGFACRRTMASAIRAALLEAIQTRASVIAGGREDITRRFYPKRWDEQVLAFERSQMLSKPERQPETLCAPAGETVPSLVSALAAEGLHAIAVPICEIENIPLHIARVVTLASHERVRQ